MKNGFVANFFPIFISGILISMLSATSAYGDPILSNIETKNLEYTAGSGSKKITGSIEITNGFYLTSATVRILSGFQASEDVLIYKEVRGVTGSWNKETGVMYLTGFASLSRYKDALRNIFYENTNTSDPSTETRVISFTVNDGTNNSNTVTRSITVISPNQAPVLTNLETEVLTYCMNSDVTGITNAITVQDADNSALASATVRITTGYYPDEDELIFANQGGISGSWNNSSGTLTLSGTALLGSYQQALRSIQYQNKKPENPSGTFHEISFVVSDGKLSSNTLVRGIVHDIPGAVISGNTSICAGSNALLTVNLTGSAPWKISYRRNSGNIVTINGILSSPYNLSVNEAGTYTLTGANDKFCTGNVSGSAVVALLPVPEVHLTGLDPIYSKQSEEWIPLTGFPAGGEFSGPGVIPYGNEWFFIPSLPAVGVHNIVYKYRASPDACFGYDTVSVRILEKSAAIQIENDRTKFCQSDPPFLVTGINLINGNYGTFSINGGTGLVDNHNNTATVYPAMLDINQYTITYTSFDLTTVPQNVDIGSPLKADFKWNTECFEDGQTITFTNISSSPFGFLNEGSYRWNLYGSNDSVSWLTRDFAHNFAEPGNYRVELNLENSYGCVAKTEKTFPLRPIISIAGENYFENFEDAPAWHTENDPSVGINSWELGMNSKPDSAAYSGINYWYTDITSNPAPHEHSWITSPCFNFMGTDKPTLVAQIKRSFSDNRDGVNVQYTIDNGLSWEPIGGLNDGINWYNNYFGASGEQAEGWTNIRDAGWVETRHILDFLRGQPRVQFRFAYNASGSSFGSDGIAIDDIRIVERNRNILFEHFTNSSAADCAIADSMLNSLVQQSGNSIIDLQYHTDDPDDPLHADNPIIPENRQFYYGLSRVPYALINGGLKVNQRIDYVDLKPSEKQIGVESLYDSDFKIAVTSMLLDTAIYFKALITSLHNVPLTEISVRVVIVEPAITNIVGKNGVTLFRNVVKAMLPDAAGYSLYKTWDKNESVTLMDSWAFRNVYDSTHLRVVVFLQNEKTREINQAAMDTRGIFSDIHDQVPQPADRSFTVYPNPAKNRLFIKSGQNISGDLKVELFNIMGGLVYDNQEVHSENVHTISLDALPQGIYLLRVSTPERILGNRKILVSH